MSAVVTEGTEDALDRIRKVAHAAISQHVMEMVDAAEGGESVIAAIALGSLAATVHCLVAVANPDTARAALTNELREIVTGLTREALDKFRGSVQ